MQEEGEELCSWANEQVFGGREYWARLEGRFWAVVWVKRMSKMRERIPLSGGLYGVEIVREDEAGLSHTIRSRRKGRKDVKGKGAERWS